MQNPLFIFIILIVIWCYSKIHGARTFSEDICESFSVGDIFWLDQFINGTFVKIFNDQQKAKQFACQLIVQQQLIEAVLTEMENQVRKSKKKTNFIIFKFLY